MQLKNKFLSIVIFNIILLLCSNSIFANANSDVIKKINEIDAVVSYDKNKGVDEFKTVTFGKYTQNKDAYGIYNKEPVEWILIYKDDANALLMSKYILDVKAYNTKKPNFTESGIVVNGQDDKASDWAHSTLREWMNSYMYDEMFTKEEKKIINTAYLDNTYIYDTEHHIIKGIDTKDNMFLLNEYEMYNFFGKNMKDHTAKNKATRGTDYAKKRNLRSSTEGDWYKGNSDYLIRTSGIITDYVSAIKADGAYTGKIRMDNENYGIRPCIFIKLKETKDLAKITIDDALRKEIDAGDKGLSLDKYEVAKMGELEWYVIKKTDDKELLLCKNAIKRQKYNNTKKENIRWEDSDIRKYLNEDFYNVVFTNAEKEKINFSNISNEASPESNDFDTGYYTLDKIFLLSYNEIKDYIGFENRNVLSAKSKDGDMISWYLRTAAKKAGRVLTVSSEGKVKLTGEPALAGKYIRPAMWVKIK